MTIRQLPEPCFILTPNPWDRDEADPHYLTRSDADEALRERREELGPDPRDLAAIETCRVKKLDAPCWVAECDAAEAQEGLCGDTLGDEDEGPSCIHFETVDALFDWIPLERWTREAPDRAFCWWHSRTTPLEPPPLPADQEKAGQLVIPGVPHP